MYKVILILDKFLSKYKGGIKLTIPPPCSPQEKLPSKSPALLGLINWEINLILTQLANFVISEWDRATAFEITDAKLYVPVVTLSANDYVTL